MAETKAVGLALSQQVFPSGYAHRDADITARRRGSTQCLRKLITMLMVRLDELTGYVLRDL
ncbi:MAG: hypothetical protein V1737_06065 [Chloroflexota bacterium]